MAQAIAQMEKVTQSTAATAEESAAASEELTAQADGAMQIVGRLEILVGASQSSHGRTRVDAARPTPATPRHHQGCLGHRHMQTLQSLRPDQRADCDCIRRLHGA